MKQTQILKPSDETYRVAAQCLHRKGLVSFPTETVYGLGANALSNQAMTAIFTAKGRPHFNPLIIHLSAADEAQKWAEMSNLANQLAQHFWPGPLTLVVPRRKTAFKGQQIGMVASAGLDTIALRVPDGQIAQTLLVTFGAPIAAPSANLSGKLSPTRAQHVYDGLSGRIDYIVDGGPCAIGLESTILDLSQLKPILLRQGGVSVAQLEKFLGPVTLGSDIKAGFSINVPARSPGLLSSHYAPEAKLRLNASYVTPSESLLAFGPMSVSGAQTCQAVLNLSETGDLPEAAANLFQYLRDLDQTTKTQIAVMPIPETDLGGAINDRLRRAAAPRFDTAT